MNFEFGGDDTVYGDPYADEEETSSDEVPALAHVPRKVSASTSLHKMNVGEANTAKHSGNVVSEFMDRTALVDLIEYQDAGGAQAAKEMSKSKPAGPYASRFLAQSSKYTTADPAIRKLDLGKDSEAKQDAEFDLKGVTFEEHEHVVREKESQIVRLQNELAAAQIQLRNIADDMRSREKRSKQAYNARTRQVEFLQGDLKNMMSKNRHLTMRVEELEKENKSLKCSLRHARIRAAPVPRHDPTVKLNGVEKEAEQPVSSSRQKTGYEKRGSRSKALSKKNQNERSSGLAKAGKMQVNGSMKLVSASKEALHSPIRVIDQATSGKKLRQSFSFDEVETRNATKDSGRTAGFWLDKAEQSDALAWDFSST